jgi:hypothetical protein
MRSAPSLSRRTALLIAMVSPLLLGSYFKCTVVSNPAGSSARIASLEPKELRVGDVLQVTGSGNGTPPLEFSWNFGDGTHVVGQRAAHVYEAAGNYRVVLTVRDGLGNFSNDASEVVVLPRVPSPKTGVLLLSDAIAGAPLMFRITTLDPASDGHTFVWSFSDGQRMYGSEVLATFAAAGIYVASVTTMSSLDTIAVEQFAFEVEEAAATAANERPR